jgi:hypothetical protein
MRVVGQNGGDRPAGPVVEQALEQARILPSGHDHGDLGIRGLELADAALDGSRDVPVGAIHNIQRHSKDLDVTGPLLEDPLGDGTVDGDVQGQDLQRPHGPGVADRSDDAVVEPIHQDEHDVVRSWNEAHAAPLRPVAWPAVLPDHHQAHVVELPHRLHQARPASPVAEPLPPSSMGRSGDDHGQLDIVARSVPNVT